MRRAAAVAAAVAALAVLAAGCSTATAPARSGSSPSPAAPHVHAVGVTAAVMPGCTTATQQAVQLPAADVAMANAPGAPFGVAAAPAGHWAFVALGGEVGVYRTAVLGVPSPDRQLTVPFGSLGGALLGDTVTSDGRYLLAADVGTGAVVVSTRAAEDGSQHAVLGVLAGPTGQGGAIEVAVSPDGRYAFVSLEDVDQIAVFSAEGAD